MPPSFDTYSNQAMPHNDKKFIAGLFKVTLLLLLLLLQITVNAGTLKGIVKDKKGETLPFCTVFVQGTTIGTTTNASGSYLLTLSPGTYTVTCQYIGYRQAEEKITITGNETIEHNFVLQDQSLEMKEFIVKSSDEDPAYRIIRKAIEKRSFHLKQVKAFQSSIYLKGVMRSRQAPKKIMGKKVDPTDLGTDSNGKGVIYLCEEVADYYSQEPNLERNVIHSVRESGNDNGLGISQMPPVISFYENNVTVFTDLNPRGFVSPIASNALGFYKYRLEGEFKENRKTIYKIKVMPKRAYEPLFMGYIYIVDEDWAIHSLSLFTTSHYGLEKLDTLRLDQVFLPLKKDTWVIKSQVFYPTVDLMGFGFTANFVTVYDNQKVNEPVPDTIFNKRIVSIYDKTANKKDTAYWNDTRPIPLETDEEHDYRYKDSLSKILKDPHRIDSIRRRNNKLGLMDFVLNGKTLYGKENKQSFHFNSLFWMTNYNTVEGLNISPRLLYTRNLDTGKLLTAQVATRYGFQNHHFNLMGGITYSNVDKYWRSRGWMVGAEGGKYVFQYNPDNSVDPLLNTFSTLLYNDNYLKLYERYSSAIYFRRNGGNGFKWNARLEFQKRMPLENTTFYSWAKTNDGPITNNVPDELKKFHYGANNAALFHAGVSYQPGFTYVQYPDFKRSIPSSWPVFSLSYDKGVPDIINSKTDFDKWKFKIEGEQRLKLFGTLSYNLSAGGFLNSNYVGLPDLKHLDGGQFILSSASTYMNGFLIAPYYIYSNTDKIYGEAHVEYNLQGLLTNKIPLLRQAQWYFILGNNTYFAGTGNYYTEAFLSVDNLGYKVLRFLRVDFVKSWDGAGRNNFGIRFGLRAAGMIQLAQKGDNGTWNGQ